MGLKYIDIFLRQSSHVLLILNLHFGELHNTVKNGLFESSGTISKCDQNLKRNINGLCKLAGERSKMKCTHDVV